MTKEQLKAAKDYIGEPDNLPIGWEFQERTNCVVCGGCGFRYGAEHADSDGRWTCPNCRDGNGADAKQKE